MKVVAKFRSHSPAETRSAGAALAAQALPGDVFLLAGDLGAGKTTFAQGFAGALGVVEPVTSPTFTLLRPYQCGGSPNGVRVLLHADLYRLDHLDEVVDLAIAELVEDGSVALVEWGEVAAPAFGTDHAIVWIEPGSSEHERMISIEVTGDRWLARQASLAVVAPVGPEAREEV